MVSPKVKKVFMSFHKSPSHNPSSSSLSLSPYFSRSSSHPLPSHITHLLRLLHHLQHRESILQTQLLQHKLLYQNDIVSKDSIIQIHTNRIQEMELENQTLRKEILELKLKMEEEKRESQRKIKVLEDEIMELKKMKSEVFLNDDVSSTQRLQGLMEVSVRSNLINSLKKTVSCRGNQNHQQVEATVLDFKSDVAESETPSDSDQLVESTHSIVTSVVRSHASFVPKPPPTGLSSLPHSTCSGSSDSTTPPPPPPPLKAVSNAAPPPPPPPLKGRRAATAKVVRMPEVVEFYHSLMRRESHSRRDSNSVVAEVPATANTRDMIGEIENRSSYLIAVKTDVETKGDFIRSLIKEVEGASFTNIEDVVLFVKWLDDELSYLVDERAVLKHFDWPEQKADALREAAFAYCDLKKLESEAASSFRDDHRQPCGPALKKMQALLEKLEHGVYNISRMRESATNRYKVLKIPVHWMLDNGFMSQLKLASVKLAMKYMKRVSAKLETGGGGPEEEELIVQGVRFAFRVHQFAGGFDVETMRAFQELRDKARSCHVQCHSQQQKFLCRSATC
ncbi:hypothetical protein Lal_00038760 [Lupinus albus]|uniref:Uncharacterized protein n=1 Tax=Lupinus albus TaxID=3870 RepID=A0A6A4NV99_LUPAL|nr:hypothetical protein Lalb_Chr20g0121251 [Lupinus albus]KAF1882116.1 hypothetical protein Lal_00038760 [Lupinus albus]